MPPSSPARTLVLLIVLFLPFHSSTAASAAEDANLAYFRDLAETRNYTLGRPVSPQLTPDGKHALFLRSAPRDPTLKLYELDLATGRDIFCNKLYWAFVEIRKLMETGTVDQTELAPLTAGMEQDIRLVKQFM